MHTFYSQRILTILASGAVAGMLASMAVYAWLFLEVRDTVADTAQAVEEAQLLATSNAHTQTVRRVVRDTEAARAELNQFFVEETELVSFLNDLEQLGGRAGVPITVASVDTGSTVGTGGYLHELTLALEGSGSFAQLFHTLTLLEQMPVALRVDTVRLRQGDDGASWEGSFALTAIEQRELSSGE